jgi:hypothetical protein
MDKISVSIYLHLFYEISLYNCFVQNIQVNNGTSVGVKGNLQARYKKCGSLILQ